MKRDLERRIEALEENAKPPMISTFADLVAWVDEHEDGEEEVELSPELQELVELASEREHPEKTCSHSPPPPWPGHIRNTIIIREWI